MIMQSWTWVYILLNHREPKVKVFALQHEKPLPFNKHNQNRDQKSLHCKPLNSLTHWNPKNAALIKELKCSDAE